MRAIVGMQYMKGFSCLGGRCEENCCSEVFKIPFDRTDYEILESKSGCSEEMRLKLDEAFEMDVPEGFFAFTKTKEDGDCYFLSPDKLCRIHATFGEDSLGTVCRTYPRVINILGDRAEVSGAISCREVARKLFLGREPIKFIPFTREELPMGRLHIEKEIASEVVPFVDFLRECFIRILFQDSYPLLSRLYFLALFGEKLGSLASGGPADIEIMNAGKAFDLFIDRENLDKHDRIIRSIKTDATWPLDLMTAIINDKLQGKADQRFQSWMEGFGFYRSPGVFAGTKKEIDPGLRTIFDHFLIMYLCNHFIAKAIGKPEAASDFIQISLTSQMLLRFILVTGSSMNHQAIRNMEDVLKTVSRFSRFFEHDVNHEQRIEKCLSVFQVESMAHWVMMLKCLI
ncbi:MAG: flagellin lysine-N-methylase [Syntrophobacteraceae bacterium]